MGSCGCEGSSLSYELENVEGNAQALLSEMVHSAAYGGETTSLGRSQFAGRHQLGALTPEVLRQYVADNFTTSCRACGYQCVAVDAQEPR